jgi:hypothetical protein
MVSKKILSHFQSIIILYLFIYFHNYIIYLFFVILGLTNPTPLTEISASRFVTRGTIGLV